MVTVSPKIDGNYRLPPIFCVGPVSILLRSSTAVLQFSTAQFYSSILLCIVYCVLPSTSGIFHIYSSLLLLSYLLCMILWQASLVVLGLAIYTLLLCIPVLPWCSVLMQYILSFNAPPCHGRDNY